MGVKDASKRRRKKTDCVITSSLAAALLRGESGRHRISICRLRFFALRPHEQWRPGSGSLSKTSIEVQTREVRQTLVIDIRGEVDLFTSPKMRSAIVAAFNSMDISQVAVNLGGVSYIDSSGIATLVEGLQLARSTKRRFVLFGLQKGAREVLELARLDKIFDIRATEIEALGQ